MLPLCLAVPTCSSPHFQVTIKGGLKYINSWPKTLDCRCNIVDRVLDFSNGSSLQENPYKGQSVMSWYSNFTENTVEYGSISTSNSWSSEDKITNFPDQIVEASSVSDSLSIDIGSLSNSRNTSDVLADVNKTVNESVIKGKTALTASVDTISSSVADVLKGVKETLNNVVDGFTSSVDQSGDLASTKLSGLSSRVGVIAIDALRHTIVIVEDSLAQGGKYFAYAYGSTKEVLPQEIQDVLNLTEEKTIISLKPVGSALQQAYVALENFEKSLGIDPNDPVVGFLLFLGASVAIWSSYQTFTYGGYSGDLSPKSTFSLLKGKENAVLIDIRPEDLRDKDGIPDLRRRARSRYANVDFLEVDSSISKLLRSGKDLDDSLIASVIRNLKIVQGRPKVIIMDADGSRSKGVARSLRRLGTKETYLVHGGFRSWVKEGLRIKEMRPETTLTILNEEAEAILEEINPSPLQLLGYGAGLTATAFAIADWEYTLQLVGILGLGVTLYRRLASYEDSDDFKEDIQLLLAPVKVGGQAILSAAGQLETSRNGLPTSPSSTDVQNRVLQAAAKHESRPSDEEIQDSSSLPESTTNNVEISEA